MISMEFRVERDYVRRESLSPFLFDIDMEGLSVLFNRASTSGLFKGIHCGNGCI
jgi:hypothetical protein